MFESYREEQKKDKKVSRVDSLVHPYACMYHHVFSVVFQAHDASIYYDPKVKDDRAEKIIPAWTPNSMKRYHRFSAICFKILWEISSTKWVTSDALQIVILEEK